MGMFDKNKFKSANQEWETPEDLFEQIDSRFHFTRDVCASINNTKRKEYYSADNSCLNKTWDGVNWMNPPYGNMKVFVKKAYEQRGNAVTVCLIPAKTNTNWWHEYCMKGEVYFICGRPRFKGCKHGLPFPLSLVVFGKKEGKMGSFYLPKKARSISRCE